MSLVSPPPPFEIVAGHLTLDFINTLDDRFHPRGPAERLNSYSDLLRFTSQTRLIEPPVLQSIATMHLEDLEIQALDRALALREILARLHYGRLAAQPPSDDDLQSIGEFQKVIAQRRQLVPTQNGFEWKWTDAEYDVSLPVWTLAAEAVALLTSPSLSQVRACECSTCRWLFLDTSKNHRRRWCDMKVCGNRMKARRFLASLNADARPLPRAVLPSGSGTAGSKARTEKTASRQDTR